MAITCTLSETGFSDEVAGTEILYFVDFDAHAGSGTAQLEVALDGTWYPADVPYTANMLSVRATDIRHSEARSYRWNVTVTGGKVVTVLDRN